jgi:hypothetical protein
MSTTAEPQDEPPPNFTSLITNDDVLRLLLSFVPTPSLVDGRSACKRFRSFTHEALCARHGPTAVADTVTELEAESDPDERINLIRDWFGKDDTRELVLAALGEVPGTSDWWSWESQDPRDGRWVRYTTEITAALDASNARGERRHKISIGGKPFEVDFVAGKQYNRSKSARPVRRERLADFEDVVPLMLPFIDDGPDGSDARRGAEGRQGPSLSEGRRLVSAMIRCCGPCEEQLHVAICSLVRNHMLGIAQHVARGHPGVLDVRPEDERPPLFHAVRNFGAKSILWLVSAGQDLTELASAPHGGDTHTVLSYAYEINSGATEWLLKTLPECANVPNAPRKHREALESTRLELAQQLLWRQRMGLIV